MELDTAEDSARDTEPSIDGHSDQLSTAQSIEDYARTEGARGPRVTVEEYDHSYQQARWTRLSKYYNDKYLDFFIQDQNREEEENDSRFTTSQYGSVTWTGIEKNALFCALSTKGRHNLPDLAAAVRTKSVIETRDYLGRLKTADAEHQMFAPHSKNVSLAEMDAAVEVNGAWEEKLERAADALAAFQDKFDLARVRGDGGLWLIDTETADVIDEENETRELSEVEQSGQVSDSDEGKDKPLHLFQFGTMLQLSRALFMNPSDESDHDHWTTYAEDEEEPSLTVDAVQVLHNLVKSFTQRVLQTAIFLAQSRIRSTTRTNYTPTEVLKDIDVVAALNVLSLPVDPWEYWTKFARRSGVRVVLGDHRKGQNNPLTLEQVESTLSVRSTRGRHRSLSSIVSQSSQEDLSDSNDDTGLSSAGNGVPQSVEEASSNEDEDGRNSAAISDTDSDTGLEDEVNSGDPIADEAERHVSRKRRRIMMEESQDEHLERVDYAAQLMDERLLRNVFSSDTIKEEPEEALPRKPRGQRKTKEDLEDWSTTAYYTPWEMAQLLDDSAGSSLGSDT